MEKQLDKVALPVKLAVETSFRRSFFAWRNDGFEIAELQFLQDCVCVVAAVAEARLASDKVDEPVCDSAVVLLARRDDDFQWPALQINDGVNLRRETASRTANFVFLGPPRPPAES